MLIAWANDPAATVRKVLRDCGVEYKIAPVVGSDFLPECGAGDVVLALGVLPLQILGRHKVLRKGSSIKSQREQLHELPSGAKCLVSYSAQIGDVDHGCLVDLLTDIQLAVRYIKTGSLAPQIGTYRYVKDFSEAIQYIETRYAVNGGPVRVSLDTETLGTDRFAPDGYIVSVQLTVKEGTADVVTFKDRTESKNIGQSLRSQLDWLLQTTKVHLTAANGKYDFCWMNTFWGLPLPDNYSLDTTIVGSLLNENRSNALSVHAKLVTTMGNYDLAFNSKYDKARMDLAFADDPAGFLTYAGGDTDACYRVAEKFRKQLLGDAKLSNFYLKILHPAARAYEQIEQVGWYVDIPYYEHLKDELEQEIESLAAQLREIIGGRIIAKHTDKKDGTLNITKAALIKDFMFSPMGLNLKPKLVTEKTNEPSTAYDHIKSFADTKAAPFIELYKRYAQARKTLSTYVINYDEKGLVSGGFMSHLRSDGRFHPNYFLFSGYDDWGDEEGGTVSGRLSVHDPAIQTLPAHTSWTERIRRAFIAPPGHVIIAADYDQGELRLIACRANEPTMIEAYKSGKDLHALTGSEISGYTWEEFCALQKTDPKLWAEIRQRGKPANFGLVYGQLEEGFMLFAQNKYGMPMTLAEATGYREGFFNLYPKLVSWHNAEIQHGFRYGYVRSSLGRIRHLPLMRSPDRMVASRERRRSINSPIQSALSDMSLWVAAILWKRGSFKNAPFFGMVHDQNLRYAPEDQWEKWAKETKEVSENLPFAEVGWQPQLTFPVDLKIGPNLGDLVKVNS